MAEQDGERGLFKPVRSAERQMQVEAEREQKRELIAYLRDITPTIREHWRRAYDEKDTSLEFTLPDSVRGILSRAQMTDALRGWLFNTFGQDIGLNQYKDETGRVMLFFGWSKPPGSVPEETS